MTIDWNPALEQAICEGIESGLTLRAAAAKNGVSQALILKKVVTSTSFREQYAHAIDTRTDLDFEGLTEALEQEPERTQHGVDTGWVNWKRLQIDTMKWALSKRCPKKYGDKVQQEVTGAGGGPVEVIVRRVGGEKK